MPARRSTSASQATQAAGEDEDGAKRKAYERAKEKVKYKIDKKKGLHGLYLVYNEKKFPWT